MSDRDAVLAAGFLIGFVISFIVSVDLPRVVLRCNVEVNLIAGEAFGFEIGNGVTDKLVF